MILRRRTSAGPPGRPLLLLFKLAALIAGLWLTSHSALAQAADFLRLDLYHWLIVFTATWAAALVTFAWVAFTPVISARIVWTVLLGLATLAGEVYFQVTEDRLTINALDAMRVSDIHFPDTVALFAQPIGAAVLRTALLVTGLLMPPSLGIIPRWRPLVLLPLAPCALTGAVIVYDAASDGFETRGLPSGFHNLSLFALYPLSNAPPQAKAAVDIERVRPPAARRVVLIVDESVSGDFIDLNVQRGITPFLAARPPGLVSFGLATAASTCSNASNAVLRLGADPQRLGSSGYSFLANPSIWKYADEAGFETTLIDAQGVAQGRQNFMDRGEIELIDRVLTVPAGVRATDRDFTAQQLLLEVLSRRQPQFVYFNKYGVHFPYHVLVPEEEALFQPAMRPFEPSADRERLVNSYRNAILRTVDGFFAKLLPRLDLAETLVIYTSDHGQNLLDDGKPVTHCRRLGTSPFEAVVPLLVFTRDAMLHRLFDEASAHNFGRASHFEVFPTLLELFGYDPASVRDRYHQSLFERIEHPMGFLSGPVVGRFGRQPVWHPRDELQALER